MTILTLKTPDKKIDDVINDLIAQCKYETNHIKDLQGYLEEIAKRSKDGTPLKTNELELIFKIKELVEKGETVLMAIKNQPPTR